MELSSVSCLLSMQEILYGVMRWDIKHIKRAVLRKDEMDMISVVKRFVCRVSTGKDVFDPSDVGERTKARDLHLSLLWRKFLPSWQQNIEAVVVSIVFFCCEKS